MKKNAVTPSRQRRRPQSVISGLLLALLASTSGTLRADAIIRNQAMKAVSIAQYYVEEEGVRAIENTDVVTIVHGFLPGVSGTTNAVQVLDMREYLTHVDEERTATVNK